MHGYGESKRPKIRKFERSRHLAGNTLGLPSACGLPPTQPFPAARQNRHFTHSPIDTLIDLVVWLDLRCHIPVWLDLCSLTHLRIKALPQRWPACRG
jgi:hypothetical protein